MFETLDMPGMSESVPSRLSPAKKNAMEPSSASTRAAARPMPRPAPMVAMDSGLVRAATVGLVAVCWGAGAAGAAVGNCCVGCSCGAAGAVWNCCVGWFCGATGAADAAGASGTGADAAGAASETAGSAASAACGGVSGEPQKPQKRDSLSVGLPQFGHDIGQIPLFLTWNSASPHVPSILRGHYTDTNFVWGKAGCVEFLMGCFRERGERRCDAIDAVSNGMMMTSGSAPGAVPSKCREMRAQRGPDSVRPVVPRLSPACDSAAPAVRL